MSDIVTGLWTTLRDGALSTQQAVVDAASVETIRLAVTGLSRAGKTVFTVSLIGNLLAMGQRRLNALPALAKLLDDGAGGSRLLGVEIEPSGAQRIPRFPYESHREDLAGGPGAHWPPSTEQPALLTLRLLLKPQSFLGQAKSWLLGPRVVRLELLDYPGEWLVDLPLLEQSHAEWSRETLGRLRRAPRDALFAEFLAFLLTLRPDAPADEALAGHGFRLYRDALRRSRDEAGLRWLQPGRFLMPGPWGEAPFLHFFPCDTGSPPPGSLGALLRDRFEAYKREIRAGFFETHFNSFHRQVVLVDVLGALFAGRTAFEDVSEALGRIGAAYGRLLDGGWLPGPLGGASITRVAFAATKADHVPGMLRDNLRLTLEHMAGGARPRSSFHALAAIRCTRDDRLEIDGRMTPVVMGVPLGETRQRPFSPGIVPAGAVSPDYWSDRFFELPRLHPPEVAAGSAQPMDHIGLDALLVALLEDVL
jgi:predicted YcjX-like family ATPase